MLYSIWTLINTKSSRRAHRFQDVSKNRKKNKTTHPIDQTEWYTDLNTNANIIYHTPYYIHTTPYHSTSALTQPKCWCSSVSFLLVSLFCCIFSVSPSPIWCVAFNTSTETMYSSGCVHVRVYHPDLENFNIFKWILVGRIRIIIIFFSFIWMFDVCCCAYRSALYLVLYFTFVLATTLLMTLIFSHLYRCHNLFQTSSAIDFCFLQIIGIFTDHFELIRLR